MKRNYTTSIIQRGICLFLLVPLILGISISEMRASTQALYRAWDLNVYSMENMAWEYEVLENKEEREEKDKLEYYVSEVQSLNHTYGFEGSDDFVLLPQQREKYRTCAYALPNEERSCVAWNAGNGTEPCDLSG